jgi:hypothetical protein
MFHGCQSNAECQYRACLDRTGYINTLPSYAQTGLTWYTQCALNASLGGAYVCQYSTSFIDWSSGTGVGVEEYGPCIPGPCLPGRYKTDAGEITTCQLCPEGTYNADPWATACNACPKGKYQGRTEQSSCDNCPVGTYGPNTGKTSMSSACVPCPSGYFSHIVGVVHCFSCPIEIPFRVGYYQSTDCSTTYSQKTEPCAVCDNGRACSKTEPTQCGVTECTTALLGTHPDYSEWLTAEYKCRPGQYLRGFNTTEDKDCRPCPSGMVGLDGVKCEWCAGPLEEPYWLDQSSCVCKAPAVMNRTGGCECPDGWRFNDTASECEACPINTYGRQGRCYDCGAGNFSAAGATGCTQCVYGKYRLQGDKECRSCANATQFYAPNAWSDECVGCNRSCDGLPGWRDNGPCPSGIAGYRVCAPCEIQLPNHSTWVAPGGGCVYKCDPGYYFNEWDGGACKPCSTAPCPPGLKGTACTDYADRVCDSECVNTSKPTFHSVWAEAGPAAASPCPWVCEDGYEAVETDYWMFQLHECVPVYDAG